MAAAVDQSIEKLRIQDIPGDALRAFALAWEAKDGFIQVLAAPASDGHRSLAYHHDYKCEAIPYPHATDFEVAAHLGLVIRLDVRPSRYDGPGGNAACYRRPDDLSLHDDKIEWVHRALGEVERLDYEAAMDIPGAIPVAFVGYFQGLVNRSGGGDAAMGMSRSGDAHYAHGYLVDETRSNLMLRGMTLRDGNPANAGAVGDRDLLHIVKHAFGTSTCKHVYRVVTGMSREAFLETVEVERQQASAIVEAGNEYAEAVREASARMYSACREAHATLSSCQEGIAARLGLEPPEDKDGPRKAMRLVERTLGPLNRPAGEVARELVALEVAGASPREILGFMNSVGFTCVPQSYQKRVATLKEALELVSPASEEDTPSAPHP